MAKTRTEIKFYGEAGKEAREALIVIKGIPGLAAAGVSAYVENPFYVDAIVDDIIVEITTLEAGDEDIDIGTGNSATDTPGTELVDSIINTGAFCAKCVDGTTTYWAGCTVPSNTVLKAKGNATDSFIIAYQNGTNGASTLVYTLYIRLIAKDSGQA